MVAVKYDRKAVLVMERERMGIRVWAEEVDLLKELVDAEIDRRCVALDDIILRVYAVQPHLHTDKAIAEVKAAVLELVRSPLADLEGKLACVEVEPEPEPEPEVEVKPEPEVEVETKPGKEPGKAKA
ncbi:hypothetical protein ES705_34517 [subsurface metagenome]